MSKNDTLTQELVRDLFNYDTTTGQLYWRETGKIAGYHSKRYVVIGINNKQYYAHRVIWIYVYGELPDQIDHINKDKKDNRLSNLRNVSASKNHMNKKMQANNKTGRTGVYKVPRKNNPWRATITVKQRRFNLGSFSTFEDACNARSLAELNHGFHQGHGGVV